MQGLYRDAARVPVELLADLLDRGHVDYEAGFITTVPADLPGFGGRTKRADGSCQTVAGNLDLGPNEGGGEITAVMFRLFVALILAAEIIGLAALEVAVPDVQVLVLIPIVPLTLAVALLTRRFLDSAAYRMRRLSPETITAQRHRAQADESPEGLSRSIVERATEIRRALSESPSEIRVEMCALGYRACVNDMITLTHLTNEELQNASIIKRMKLRRARKRATDALVEAREALPPGALRATRQEQQ